MAAHGSPAASSQGGFYDARADSLYEQLGAVGIESYSSSVHDLLRHAAQPVAPALTRTLRDLAYSYLPAQGLPGTLHFEEGLPGIDVPEGPLRAIMEHLVEGALRGNSKENPFCHVGVVQDDADKVVLAIRDNGAALPECGVEDLRAFLQEPQAGQVPDRVHRLFLADNLAQWLGGRLSIAPTPGGNGTTVLLEIPRSRSSAPTRESLVGRHVF